MLSSSRVDRVRRRMKLFCDIIREISGHDATADADPFAKILLTTMFEAFRPNECVSLPFTSRTKFDLLESVVNDKQLSETTKSEFSSKFCESQKRFWTLYIFFTHLIRVRSISK
jgi:hypothetical protein